MSLPIITVFDGGFAALDEAHFETRSAEPISAQTIEDAIASSDGVIVNDVSPIAWYTVAVALEKYGRPTALITNSEPVFAATIVHPTFLASSDAAEIRSFFTKHFPAPVDPACEGDVCRV